MHLTVGTENVEFQGRQLETQSAQVEDVTGRIKLQLWEGQVGLLSENSTENSENSTENYFLQRPKKAKLKKSNSCLGLVKYLLKK